MNLSVKKSIVWCVGVVSLLAVLLTAGPLRAEEGVHIEPCPKCHRELTLIRDTFKEDWGGWRVHCNNCVGQDGCGYRTADFGTEIEAIEAHNKHAIAKSRPKLARLITIIWLMCWYWCGLAVARGHWWTFVGLAALMMITGAIWQINVTNEAERKWERERDQNGSKGNKCE